MTQVRKEGKQPLIHTLSAVVPSMASPKSWKCRVTKTAGEGVSYFHYSRKPSE